MITIRKAIPADIDIIRSLAREIWNECYAEIISTDQIGYMLEMMYSRQVIGREMADGVNWHILEDDAEPVGFLAFAIDGKKAVMLNKLYVQSGRHGKGFGQKALNYVVEFAEQNGFQNVYLTVNKKNLRAMAAYERKGFVRSESIVNDIGNGYVMDDFVYKFQIE